MPELAGARQNLEPLVWIIALLVLGVDEHDAEVEATIGLARVTGALVERGRARDVLFDAKPTEVEVAQVVASEHVAAIAATQVVLRGLGFWDNAAATIEDVVADGDARGGVFLVASCS